MRMAYPQRNLVDQIWKDRPSKSAAPIYMHELRFAGESRLLFTSRHVLKLNMYGRRTRDR